MKYLLNGFLEKELLLLEPENVLQNLNNAIITPELLEGYNFLLIAEVSKQNSRKQEGLVWLRVALKVHNILERKPDKEFFLRAGMNCRVQAIEKFGHSDGDDLLDSNKVINWFWLNVKGSYENIVTDAKDWRKLEVPRIRELRNLKIAISYLLRIKDFLNPSKFDNWFKVYELLP